MSLFICACLSSSHVCFQAHIHLNHVSQWELRVGLQAGGQTQQQYLHPAGAVCHRLCHLHDCWHLLQRPCSLYPPQVLHPCPGQVQGVLPAVCQQPGGHRPAGPHRQWFSGAGCLQFPQELGEVRPPPRHVYHFRCVHGLLRPESSVHRGCHGCGALHRNHYAHLPLHSGSLIPHEEAAGTDLGRCSSGGYAACCDEEALQGAELQELVFLPHGGAQRLAGCAAPSPVLSAGVAGPAAVNRM